jgi:hypothetical protein
MKEHAKVVRNPEFPWPSDTPAELHKKLLGIFRVYAEGLPSLPYRVPALCADLFRFFFRHLFSFAATRRLSTSNRETQLIARRATRDD